MNKIVRTYPGIELEENGGMTMHGRIIRDAWVFGILPENDGCADIDSDGDGVVDRVDRCPFEPEVYNGVADDDGCPDDGAALAQLVPGQIAIFEPLRFDKAGSAEKLSAHSLLVLSAVAPCARRFARYWSISTRSSAVSGSAWR